MPTSNDNPHPRFIVFRLCDNDFAGPLEEAVRIIWDYAQHSEHWDAERFKDCAARLASDIDLCRGKRDDGGSSLDYISKSLTVGFQLYPPTEDHDGGSCAICTSTGYIWRF